MTLLDTLQHHRKDMLQAHLNHPFVGQVIAGTLPRDGFQNYLIQDYKYLITYVQGFYRCASIAPTLNQMDFCRQQANACMDEEIFGNHLTSLMSDTMDMETLNNAPLHPDAKDYIQLIQDTMDTHNYPQLLYVLSSCFIGYVDMAEHIIGTNRIDANNPYYNWLSIYTGDDMVAGRDAYIHMLADAEQYMTDTDKTIIASNLPQTLTYEVNFWNTGLTHP